MEITFDEARHVYTVEGCELPGITSRMKACGLIDDRWLTEDSRHRGTAVHLLTQLHDENDLDESSIDPALVGYLDAWKAFRSETGWVNVEPPETCVASLTYGYATRIDRIGYHAGTALTVLNLKSGPPTPWHRYQLAGEAIAWAESRDLRRASSVARVAVHVAKDGAYTVKRYTDPADLDIFRAIATVANLHDRMKEHGNG